jgi:hypothetical protein
MGGMVYGLCRSKSVLGMVRLGEAWLGAARLGQARFGRAWLGLVRPGLAGYGKGSMWVICMPQKEHHDTIPKSVTK